MKLLVLATEPISADVLREAVGPGAADDAEVLVVTPAQQSSKLRFVMSDADDAIARAEAVQEETVERLEEEGIDAAGDTGEADPVIALQDALTTFPADRIVIFRHEEGEGALFEEGFADEARGRFGVPVDERVVTR